MRDDKLFIDSNTFLYTVDELEHDKRSVAENWLLELVQSGSGVTNLQVLNEVTNVLTKEARRFGVANPFSRFDAFARFGSMPISLSTTIAARNIHESFRYSWWDCLLLASALELGCTHFLSEDLQDGQAIQGLTIVDPFAHTPEQILSPR